MMNLFFLGTPMFRSCSGCEIKLVTPCAFVTLHTGAKTSEADLISFCRDNLAHLKHRPAWYLANYLRRPPEKYKIFTQERAESL